MLSYLKQEDVMGKLFIIICVVGLFLFGYHIMKKLDMFLENNYKPYDDEDYNIDEDENIIEVDEENISVEDNKKK